MFQSMTGNNTCPTTSATAAAQRPFSQIRPVRAAISPSMPSSRNKLCSACTRKPSSGTALRKRALQRLKEIACSNSVGKAR